MDNSICFCECLIRISVNKFAIRDKICARIRMYAGRALSRRFLRIQSGGQYLIFYFHMLKRILSLVTVSSNHDCHRFSNKPHSIYRQCPLMEWFFHDQQIRVRNFLDLFSRDHRCNPDTFLCMRCINGFN